MVFLNSSFTLSGSSLNPTVTSTPSITTTYPWNKNPWDSLLPIFGSTPVLDASQAAAVSSFVSYGRDEACSSAYSAFLATEAETTKKFTNILTITSTLPDGQSTVFPYDYVQTYIDKVGNGDTPCCWDCSLYYSNLQLRYWPVATPNTGCLGTIATTTAPSGNVSSGTYDITSQGVYATGEDGFVYTSPSIYVAFPSIGGLDGCGQVGSGITSLTLAFAPGELSTVTNANPGPVPGSTVVFDPADMPCGPNNGTNGFLPDSTNYNSYQPLIGLPKKLFDLRPDWARCTNDYWQGQDPPYALTPVVGPVGPFSAPAVHITSPTIPVVTGPPASPSSHIVAPPLSTAAAQPSPIVKSHASLSPNSPQPSTPALNSPSTVPISLLPPSSSIDPSPQGASPVIVIEEQTLTDNGDPISLLGTPILYSSGVLHVGTDPQPVSAIQEIQSLIVAGGLTFTPMASPPPTAIATSDINAVTPVSGSPGMVIFHGQTLASGAGTTTIDGIPVFVSSGSIYIGGQAAAFPTAPTVLQPELVTPTAPVIAGQTLSILDPSAVVLGSQTLTVGQTPILVSGITVSLGSGGLVVGSSTIAIGATPTPYVAIGSETIALGPSGIVVGGTTLTPGGPGITVDGTLISLGSSEFVIGTKTEIYEPTGSDLASATGDIGGLIMSGFSAIGDSPTTVTGIGKSGSTTGYPYGTPFTGIATERSLRNRFLIACGVVLSTGLVTILWL